MVQLHVVERLIAENATYCANPNVPTVREPAPQQNRSAAKPAHNLRRRNMGIFPKAWLEPARTANPHDIYAELRVFDRSSNTQKGPTEMYASNNSAFVGR